MDSGRKPHGVRLPHVEVCITSLVLADQAHGAVEQVARDQPVSVDVEIVLLQQLRRKAVLHACMRLSRTGLANL